MASVEKHPAQHGVGVETPSRMAGHVEDSAKRRAKLEVARPKCLDIANDGAPGRVGQTPDKTEKITYPVELILATAKHHRDSSGEWEARMPVRESAIPSPDIAKALNRLVEMLGLLQFDTVAAGVALFPYGVVDQLESSAIDPGATIWPLASEHLHGASDGRATARAPTDDGDLVRVTREVIAVRDGGQLAPRTPGRGKELTPSLVVEGQPAAPGQKVIHPRVCHAPSPVSRTRDATHQMAPTTLRLDNTVRT